MPTLVASADWEPGFKFQITPVDVVTLYGLIDATISTPTIGRNASPVLIGV